MRVVVFGGRDFDDRRWLYRCEQLPDMDVSSLAGCDLVYFCGPHRCHGDSILLKANFRVVAA